jgi:hypothetical protein
VEQKTDKKMSQISMLCNEKVSFDSKERVKLKLKSKTINELLICVKKTDSHEFDGSKNISCRKLLLKLI